MLVAVVVAALLARRSPRALVATTAPRSVDAGVDASTRGLDAPLSGPAPPPDAGAITNAPRMLHGGPRHTHRAAAIGPKAARVGWRVPVGGPVAAQVTASPDEATLYAATLAGKLVALARADGTTRWTVDLGDRVYATPLVGDDGTVYVGSDAKRFFAIGPSGTTIFRLELEGEADTGPAFGKDGTVVFAAGNHVYSTRRGGDLSFRYATRKKVFTGPAVTAEGLTIVGSQDHHVHALTSTGTLAWTIDLGADVDGAPAIDDDGAIYVGTDAGDVVKLDPSGHLVWRTPVGGFVRGTLALARNGDVLAGTYGPVPRIVRVASDGVIRGAFAIRGTGAREFGIHGAPLEDAAGVLYFGAQDDVVRAVALDGTERWRFETGGDVDAPLSMLGDGSLIVPSEDGTVTLLLP